MEEEQLKILRIVTDIAEMVKNKPTLSIHFIKAIEQGIQEATVTLMNRESNLWLVVKNIKPEHLEEMKKLIVPEVFESLGIK